MHSPITMTHHVTVCISDDRKCQNLEYTPVQVSMQPALLIYQTGEIRYLVSSLKVIQGLVQSLVYLNQEVNLFNFYSELTTFYGRTSIKV